MTQEESVMMWKMELEHFKPEFASKEVKKLYKTLDKVITNAVIAYEDFTNDMIDELTTLLIENTNNEVVLDKAEQVDTICKRLNDKYEEKYNKRESLAGDKELSDSNTEIQNEPRLCEPEYTDEESRGNTEETSQGGISGIQDIKEGPKCSRGISIY